MIIGIDASRAVKQGRTGPEQYSWEIIHAITEIKQIDQFRLYAPHLPTDDLIANETNVTWKIIERQRLWSQMGLAKELIGNRPDVLFVPSHVIPFTAKLSSVVTIHDVAYRYFPGSYSLAARNYLHFTTAMSSRKAKRIIVPSEATKRDVIKEYPGVASKIVVIPLGINHATFNPNIEGERPMSEPYILFTGRVEEKKNVKLLVEAFGLLCKEKNDVKLVLIGKNGFGFEKVDQAIKQLPLEIQQRIVRPGFVSRAEHLRYLKHAALFAFPSLYEGFGLAAIEAMAVGTPVVCSDTPALTEAAGGAAVLLPPNNPLSWAAAFSRIIHQPQLASELRAKGLKNAGQYSWARAAEATLEVIHDAAN
jgi:glycosyltransferase involved in cell wall biosynthesis